MAIQLEIISISVNVIFMVEHWQMVLNLPNFFVQTLAKLITSQIDCVYKKKSGGNHEYLRSGVNETREHYFIDV